MHTLFLAAFLSAHAINLSTSCDAFSKGYAQSNPVSAGSCRSTVAVGVAVDAGLVYLVESNIQTSWKRYAIYSALAGVHGVTLFRNRHTMGGK